MAKRIIWIPAVYAKVGGVGIGLPADCREVRRDFVERHQRYYPHWRLRTILRRYRNWVAQEHREGRA